MATASTPSSKRADDARRMVAGGVAGALARSAVTPLDVLKIRFQVQDVPIRPGAHAAQPHVYTSTLHAVRCLLREDGVRALWRGNVPAMALWTLYSAVQFPVYHGVMRTIAEHSSRDASHPSPWWASLFAGAVAGCAGTACSYPFDRIRTILAVQGVPPVYRGTMHAAMHTVQTGGPTALFKGLAPALAQVAPYVGLSFCLFEALEPAFQDTSPIASASQRGAAAGFVSKLIVYPLDTVKRRVQVAGLTRHHSYAALHHYSGTWHVVQSVWAKESIPGFFKGVVPSLLKSTLAASLSFTLFGAVDWLLGDTAVQ